MNNFKVTILVLLQLVMLHVVIQIQSVEVPDLLGKGNFYILCYVLV